MNYVCIGMGPDDIRLTSTQTLSIIANPSPKDAKDPNNAKGSNDADAFVSANIDNFGYFKPYRVFDVAGKKIGMTTVIGDKELGAIQGLDPDYQTKSADEALKEVVPQLQSEHCDAYVLAVNADLDTCRDFAKRYPLFDFVLAGSDVGEPTREPEPIQIGDHLTSFIEVGSKGMDVVVVGLYFQDGKLTSRYQRVPMDARFENNDRMITMKGVFKDYQDSLGRMPWDKDGLNIVPKPYPTPGRTFVGTTGCKDCHEVEYEIWEKGHIDNDNPQRIGPHSCATADLLKNPNGERTWVSREHDPECLSCHVTGWDPQGFQPYESGYTSIEDKDLHGNGCENCHGPCSEHVKLENLIKAGQKLDRDTRNQRDKLTHEIRITLRQARQTTLCTNCHDLDNSPDFNFEKYWPTIDHGLKAKKKLEAAKKALAETKQ